MFGKKIGTKMLVLFMTVAMLPLIVVQIFWYQAEKKSMRAEAEDHQVILVNNAEESIARFIDDKVNILIIHSQTSSIQDFKLDDAKLNMNMLVNQDSDISTVTLIDNTGKARLSIDKSGTNLPLTDLVNSDEFKVTTYLGGKEYISPVQYDDKNVPYIKIAVPLITYEKRQSLEKLSTSEPGLIRASTDIKGVLVSTVSLGSEWNQLLSNHIGHEGTLYVVDSTGGLIGHSDSSKLLSKIDWTKVGAVSRFLANPTADAQPMVSKSADGETVLSTYRDVSRPNWGVISEEPISSINQTANHIGHFSLIIFGISSVIVAITSLLLSRRITRPIRKLAAQAKEISNGNLEAHATIKSGDEIGQLSDSFNAMSDNLSQYIARISSEGKKLNFVLNSVHEGILAIGGDGQIMFVNTAASVMVGMLPKDVTGKRFIDVFRLEQSDKPYPIDLDNFAIIDNITLRSQNNLIRNIDLIVNKIEHDPNGMVAIITVIDRTKERELERMKIDFVSMAAHELRTPVTAIRGYLSLLAKDSTYQSASEEVKKYVSRANNSSMQLSGLINNLLSVSRIERGAFETNMDKYDWAKTLTDAVADQQMAASQRQIDLRYDGPAEGAIVLIDETAMREVVNNLISNALRYTDSGGKITVSLIRRNDSEWLTTVADNGAGIDKASQENLFTKFYRAHGGLASGSGGTGLGLYISKEIVGLHGGRIWVESTEGQGSRFSFTLRTFDEKQYQEIINSRPTGLRKRRGWITKNTTS